MSVKKPTIKSFNFIKAICALGIIAYHFSCHLQSREFLPCYNFKNGDWGAVFVTIFFAVSGGLLYYNYSDQMTPAIYYKKRWKSIYPMYYIAYLSFELGNIFDNGSIFFRGSLFPYLYTLLGIDGYLMQNVPTYYILGEWFLGAIIALYILFPIILCFLKKNSVFVCVFSIAVYIVFLGKPIINPIPFWSITSCLVSFVCGMTIVKYRSIILCKWISLISGIGCLMLCVVKFSFSADIGNHLMGILLFIVLCMLGEWLMKNHLIDQIFTEISRISYAIFLLQHIAIYRVLGTWNPASPVKILILLLCTMLLVLCEAKILTVITDSIVKKTVQIGRQAKILMKNNCGKKEEKI